MSAEDTLCDLMAYDRAILFPRAREALAAWCGVNQDKIRIPSNCCPALLPFAKELVPVDSKTGLAPVPVQLYGYREEFPGAKLEIDTLMTGVLGAPFATSTIISFGYAKTIDIGAGGAILTKDKSLAGELDYMGFFPSVLRTPLEDALASLHSIIMQKKLEYEEIEKKFHNWVLPCERPVLPWRFVARTWNIERLAQAADEYKFSTNYGPLPGVTDLGAIQFGKEVINIWK